MEDRNCYQNREELSTLPVKVSSLIAGRFTECIIEREGIVAVGCVGPLMLNRAVEADRLLSIRLLAFWIARLVL
jgi:hypothetical protein